MECRLIYGYWQWFKGQWFNLCSAYVQFAMSLRCFMFGLCHWRWFMSILRSFLMREMVSINFPSYFLPDLE